MPNFDGTGPQSKGPMTGMKKGECRNEEKTVVIQGCLGRGNGRNRIGRGCMRGQGQSFGR